jgi:2-iminobutanoate/2-iminopropanoate deaminase
MRAWAAWAIVVVLGTAPARAADRKDIRMPERTDSRPFSDDVQVGDTVYLAGKLGLDRATNKPPADAAEEARLILDGMKATLAQAGLTMEDLVTVQVFCSDVAHYDTFNKVYAGYFKSRFPARAFIGSGPLLYGARFEVQGVAVRTAPRAADAGQVPGPAWERLKSLAGEWEGRSAEGAPVRASYRLVSDGTALLETAHAPDSSQMVTVYHPDGDSVLMTHYCSLGNQSRMRARSLADGRLDFTFVDASNRRSADDHLMTRLVLGFPAADRLVQEWTSRAGGQENVGRSELRRK